MRFALFALPGLCSAAAVVSRDVDYTSRIHPQTIPRQEGGACTTPTKRVEFRTLDAATRSDYIDAIWCLTKKPSRLGLETSLYDDFTYVHTHLNEKIHFVAQFLPWHRYFLQLYENELRTCGYTGPLAYWDWSLDVADPVHSSFWDAETGVGGDGVNALESNRRNDALLDNVSGGVYFCVEDGPFAGLNVSYYRTEYRPHCLSRNFNNGIEYPGDMLSFAYTPEVLAKIQAIPGYDWFRQNLEGNPHGAVHASTGGDMGPSSSPNDPIFMMHHAQIDRLWSQWQQANATHATDYRGRRTQDVEEDTDEVSLDDVMPFLGFAEDLKVADVMSHKTSLLCYEYE